MNTNIPFYILSGALGGDSSSLAQYKTETLAAMLRALGYAVGDCRGCYRGESEPSVIVLAENSARTEMDVLRLARQFGQESVLAVDANNGAALIYCADERRESLGRFREVSKHVAESAPGYTERAGRYYVAA